MSEGDEAWGFDLLNLDGNKDSQRHRQRPQTIGKRPGTIGRAESTYDDWGFDSPGAETSQNVRSSTRGFTETEAEDEWGFVPSSMASALEARPLGAAILQLNHEEISRLLDTGADARVTDYEGKNYLHLLSDVPQTIISGSQDWNTLVGTTTAIVKLLVDAGAEVDACSKDHDNPTPLLATVKEDYFGHSENDRAEGHVIMALLSAGANTAALTSYSCMSILSLWAELDARRTAFPQAYFTVMDAIISRTTNLRYEEESGHPWLRKENLGVSGPFNALAHYSAKISLEQFKMAVLRLTDKTHPRPANPDTLGRTGLTPLMNILGHSHLPRERAAILIDAGAKADIVTFNSSVTSDLSGDKFSVVQQLCSSRYRTDEEDASVLRWLVDYTTNLDKDCESGHSRVVDVASTYTLSAAAFNGRIRTVELLLQYGMANRAADLVALVYKPDKGIPDTHGTVMDVAFFGAQHARRVYLEQLIRLPTSAEREVAISQDVEWHDGNGRSKLYHPLTGLGLKYKDHEIRDAPTAYWAYPALLKLLAQHGFKRSKPSGPEHEPSWYDATELLFLGPGGALALRAHDQPHREHWQILYDLEILNDSWEERALAQIARRYRQWPDEDFLERAEKRWPGLKARLQAEGHLKGK